MYYTRFLFTVKYLRMLQNWEGTMIQYISVCDGATIGNNQKKMILKNSMQWGHSKNLGGTTQSFNASAWVMQNDNSYM